MLERSVKDSLTSYKNIYTHASENCENETKS
jgi:hypothetical protein